jgi:hypothetical protein
MKSGEEQKEVELLSTQGFGFLLPQTNSTKF